MLITIRDDRAWDGKYKYVRPGLRETLLAADPRWMFWPGGSSPASFFQLEVEIGKHTVLGIIRCGLITDTLYHWRIIDRDAQIRVEPTLGESFEEAVRRVEESIAAWVRRHEILMDMRESGSRGKSKDELVKLLSLLQYAPDAWLRNELVRRGYTVPPRLKLGDRTIVIPLDSTIQLGHVDDPFEEEDLEEEVEDPLARLTAAPPEHLVRYPAAATGVIGTSTGAPPRLVTWAEFEDVRMILLGTLETLLSAEWRGHHFDGASALDEMRKQGDFAQRWYYELPGASQEVADGEEGQGHA